MNRLTSFSFRPFLLHFCKKKTRINSSLSLWFLVCCFHPTCVIFCDCFDCKQNSNLQSNSDHETDDCILQDTCDHICNTGNYATVIAYGSRVDTWFTWLHCAPADAMIVVSEIGEQWSPQTAPAIQAEIEMIIIVSFVPWNTATTIGIRIPNVPQEVPVANARKHPTRKMIAGRRFINPPVAEFITEATNGVASETVCHCFQSPCECKNQDSRNHCLKSFRNASHRIRKTKNFSY